MQTLHIPTIEAVQVLDNEARQVKHTMHYSGSLYCLLRHGCILLLWFVLFVLIFVFFFTLKAFVLPSERRGLCLHLHEHTHLVHVHVDGAPLSLSFY